MDPVVGGGCGGGSKPSSSTAAALIAAGNDEKNATTASLELAAALHQSMNNDNATTNTNTGTTTDNVMLPHIGYDVSHHHLPPGLPIPSDTNHDTTGNNTPAVCPTTDNMSPIVEVASTPGALGLTVQPPPPPTANMVMITSGSTTTSRDEDDDLVSTRLELYESRKTLERLMFENSELQRLIEQLEVEVHNQRQLNSNGMRGYTGGGLIPRMQQDKRLNEDLRDLQQEFDRVQEEKGEMKKVYSEQIQQLTQLLSYAALKLQQQQEQQQQQVVTSPIVMQQQQQTPNTHHMDITQPQAHHHATTSSSSSGVVATAAAAGHSGAMGNVVLSSSSPDTDLNKALLDSRDALQTQLVARDAEIDALTKHYTHLNDNCLFYQRRLAQFEYDINNDILQTNDDGDKEEVIMMNEDVGITTPEDLIKRIDDLQGHIRDAVKRERDRAARLTDDNNVLKAEIKHMQEQQHDDDNNRSLSIDLQNSRDKLALAEDRIELLEQYIKQQSIRQRKGIDNTDDNNEVGVNKDHINNNDDNDDNGVSNMASLKQCIAATTTELHSTKEMLVKSERRYRCLLDACRDVQSVIESEYPHLMPILSPILHQQATSTTTSWNPYTSMLDDTYGSARGMVQQQQQEQQLLSGKGSIVDRKHTHSPSIDRLNALKRSIAHSFAQCERRILALEDKIDVDTSDDVDSPSTYSPLPPSPSSSLPIMIRRWVGNDLEDIYHMFTILPGLVRSLLDICTEACIDNAKLASITSRSSGDNDGVHGYDDVVNNRVLVVHREEITMLKEHIASLNDRLTDLTQLNAFTSDMRSRTYKGYFTRRNKDSHSNNNIDDNDDDDASSSSSTSLEDAVMLEREEVLKQCQLKAVEGGERIEDQLVDALRQVIYAQRNGEEIDRRCKLVIRNLNERINHLETVIVAMRVKACQHQQQQ